MRIATEHHLKRWLYASEWSGEMTQPEAARAERMTPRMELAAEEAVASADPRTLLAAATGELLARIQAAREGR